MSGCLTSPSLITSTLFHPDVPCEAQNNAETCDQHRSPAWTRCFPAKAASPQALSPSLRSSPLPTASSGAGTCCKTLRRGAGKNRRPAVPGKYVPESRKHGNCWREGTREIRHSRGGRKKSHVQGLLGYVNFISMSFITDKISHCSSSSSVSSKP